MGRAPRSPRTRPRSTQDESTLSTDQQKEAADLAQAQSDCTSANTSTPAGQATCETASRPVSADEQQVSKDQTTVSKDETALGQALAAESSGDSGGARAAVGLLRHPWRLGGTPRATGNSGSSPTQGSHALRPSHRLHRQHGRRAPAASRHRAAPAAVHPADTDTPEQIASDQAAIDTAQANLTDAEQSLNEATLTSPISGTVVRWASRRATR